MTEVEIVALLCSFLAGSESEERHYFDASGLEHHVRSDCETATTVIEVGLDDSPSSRDSIHQAIFAGILSGKSPMVILIDRDGIEGRFELEMRLVAEAVGVAYSSCKEDFIVAWATSRGLREIGLDKELDDLPQNAAYERHCDLGDPFNPP